VLPVSPGGSVGYECSFKILLIGDSGVGKSSLLVSFVAAAHLDDDIAPTIGTFSSKSTVIAVSLCLLPGPLLVLLLVWAPLLNLYTGFLNTTTTSPWGDPPSVFCFQWKDMVDSAHFCGGTLFSFNVPAAICF
jgi:hypothetical protein